MFQITFEYVQGKTSADLVNTQQAENAASIMYIASNKIKYLLTHKSNSQNPVKYTRVSNYNPNFSVSEHMAFPQWKHKILHSSIISKAYT